MENRNKKRALLAASVAGLMAVAGVVVLFPGSASADACYVINACKGTGDCGGKGYSCAGKNACKGQGFVELQKDTCLRIQGGSLTPPAN
jgi:hypothetical protein